MNSLFVKLTLLNGSPIYVNIDRIIDITINTQNKTVIDVAEMPEEVLNVVETPEEVMFKIVEAKNENACFNITYNSEEPK